MDRGAVSAGSKVVQNRDTDLVAPICYDRWPWNTAIDSHRRTRNSIRGDCDVAHDEVVLASDSRIRAVIVIIRADVVIAPNSAVVGSVASTGGSGA